MTRMKRFTFRTGIVLVLIATLAFVWWITHHADREMRAEVLQQALVAVLGVDCKLLKEFSGTEADLKSPEYLRLKSHLSALKNSDPRYRFVYLLGQLEDGRLFFFADNCPVGDIDEAPAGMIYEEAPAGIHRVMETGVGVVDGPSTDRWGTFVSAYVAVVDPKTGKILAVLGMDFDIRTWNWNLAARVAVPVGLMLVLLIALCSVLLAHYRHDSSPKPVLRSLLFPIAGTLILLLLCSQALLWFQLRQQIDAKFDSFVSDVSVDFDNALERQGRVLSGLAGPIGTDAGVKNALREGDTAALWTKWQSVFELMRRENHLSHFYFLDKNRTALLRLHSPDKSGDRIDRFTTMEAERTGKAVTGVELGSRGTLTLRLVEPVFDGETLVGYLELGLEVKNILEPIQFGAGNQIVLLIDKQRLDKAAWQNTMGLSGQAGDWDRFPKSVLMFSTGGIVSEQLLQWVELASLAGGKESRFEDDGWRIATKPLLEASGNQVGSLLFMSDFSTENQTISHLLRLSGATESVVLSLLLGFVFITLRRTDEGIVKQQTKLRESEQSYRNQFHSNSSVMMLINAQDGGIVDVNAAAVKFYGYTRQQLLSMGMAELNTLSGYAVRMVREAMAKGQGRQFEFRHRLADGSLRDVEVSACPILFDGRIVIHSIIQDITDRKRAELERTRLAMAIEQIDEAVVIADGEGRIDYVNPAFTASSGYSREDALGNSLRILRSGPQESDFFTEMWASINGGKIWRSTMVNSKSCGQKYTELAKITPVLDDSGTIVFYVAVKRDITYELNLKAQFDQAQKMESIGRLAGGVAHDFNNMLGVILGHTELALEQVQTSDFLHNDLQEIRKAAERSSDLTRQLLAFSRQQAISPKVLDLSESITDILRMLDRLVGDDIRLAFVPGRELWPVLMDPSQIDQILANLCVNARDAMAKGGTISIETENQTIDETYCEAHAGFTPGDYVKLTVSDTGCGMDKETMRHIFEPFFTTKEQGKGTGLGLATVFGIVKQNRGFIHVYSEPGHGSRFAIYLVRHLSPVRQSCEDFTAIPPPRGNETILLVEDEKAILNMTKALLERQGYNVLAANDHVEALRFAEEHAGRIDLLMTDVVMPEINGKELAQMLLTRHAGLRVLFMSGYTASVISNQGVLEHGIHFIQKPFTLRDLAAAVRKALDDVTGRNRQAIL